MRKINWECFVQILVLLVLDSILFITLISDKMKYYVHPRMDKYVWFSVVSLLIIILSMSPMLFKPKHKINFLPCLIIIIPIITGFALPATSTGAATSQIVNNASSMVTSQTEGSFSGKSSAINDKKLTSNNSEDSKVSDVDEQNPLNTEADSQEFINADADFITVSDDDYLQWYMDAYTNPTKYDGKTVKIKGLVFKREDFAPNEFVAARMSMVCCAADLAPYGFICKSTAAVKWKNDQWVYVTAKIKVEYESHMKMKLPVLYVTEITKAEKPKEELIYLN